MKYTALALIFLIQPLVQAKNVSTSVFIEIKEMIFYSTQEPLNPAFSGMVQIDFGTIPWTPETSCNTRHAMVRGEDSHIISVLLSAQARKQPVRIYSDDSIVHGGGCVLRAVGLK